VTGSRSFSVLVALLSCQHQVPMRDRVIGKGCDAVTFTPCLHWSLYLRQYGAVGRSAPVVFPGCSPFRPKGCFELVPGPLTGSESLYACHAGTGNPPARSLSSRLNHVFKPGCAGLSVYRDTPPDQNTPQLTRPEGQESALSIERWTLANREPTLPSGLAFASARC
jgi:hypothetical protein